jgi:hypothetical protein
VLVISPDGCCINYLFIEMKYHGNDVLVSLVYNPPSKNRRALDLLSYFGSIISTSTAFFSVTSTQISAKDALNKEIGNPEPYPPQDLMKWMKKEEFNNRQKR